MNLMILDNLKQSIETVKNDIIIAEQLNDMFLYTKALVKLHFLTANICIASKSAVMLSSAILSKEQSQELVDYDILLNTCQGKI